eukprot:SAG31_NODE_3759_length_3909_cov_2.636220_8_plen_58_part_01
MGGKCGSTSGTGNPSLADRVLSGSARCWGALAAQLPAVCQTAAGPRTRAAVACRGVKR